MGKTPTQLTLKWAREQGWVAEVVEKWVPGANVRKDLFGFVDIVALNDCETVAIQATSYTNVAARIKKIAESENIGFVRKAGWKILVLGWKKEGARWKCRVENLS